MTYLSVMRDPDPGAAHELEVTEQVRGGRHARGRDRFRRHYGVPGPPLFPGDGGRRRRRNRVLPVHADGGEAGWLGAASAGCERGSVPRGRGRHRALQQHELRDANEAIEETLLAGTYYVRVQSQEAGENAHVVRYGVSAPDADDLAALQQQSDTATNAAPAFGQQGYESGTTRFTQTVRASDGSETVDTTVTVNVTDVEETADPPAAEEDEASSTLDTVSEPGDGDFSAATSTSGRVVVGETATGLRVRQTTTTAPAQPSLLPTGSILRASPPPRPACAFLREIGTSAPLSIY